MNNQENQNTNKGFFEKFAATALLIWDFAKIIIISLVIIIPIRYFIFQPFIVSGSSMEPNYQNGQYLIIDELSYHLGVPKRGDVVVLKYPKNRKEFFIKRIVGLPGEKIEVDNGKVTVINSAHPQGEPIHEPYLSNDNTTYPHDTLIIGGKKSVTLGQNEYFVFGDNRPASSDSRDWGILNRSDIVGKVFLRVLPLSEFKFLSKAQIYSF